MDIPMIKGVLLFFLLYVYNWSTFSLIDHMLENRRTKRWFLVVVSIFNAAVLFGVLFLSSLTAAESYTFMVVAMFIELCLLYRQSALRLIFFTTAAIIHIMGLRALVIGTFAIVFDCTLFVAAGKQYIWDSSIITLVILVVAIQLFKKAISVRAIKIINQHEDHLKFLTIWFVCATAYFIFNSFLFVREEYVIFPKYNMIVIGIIIFMALYTVLGFTVKVGMLLGYKERSEQLTNAAEDEKQYKHSVMEQALIAFEVNLSKDELRDGYGIGYEEVELVDNKYSQLISSALAAYVHPEDADAFFRFMSLEHIIEKFHQGIQEQSLEYRIYDDRVNGYIWVRSIFNLYKDSATDDVKAFAYAKNIDIEKRLELEIKYKSERDPLTGLFNHAMIKRLVDEFLEHQHHKPLQGALLIIDIDNFKQVNDNFGHGFGDEVLCEVSKKLLRIFRCGEDANFKRKNDDIIGRVGGDELMVFVKTANLNGLRQRAKKICEMVKTTYTTADGEPITISASIGIAIVSKQEDRFETLYAQADTALYQSKRNGKDGYTIYDEKNTK